MEVVKKDWIEQLREDVDKAEKTANEIRSQVLQPHFTIEKMSNLMRISYAEAQKKINEIAKLGYVETKQLNGIVQYKIVGEAKDRMEMIKGAIATARQNADIQITQFTALLEITSEYIKEEV